MGQLFSLDEATRATITQALDDIISEFGKQCRLVYLPRWQHCDNCVFDPIGQKSANRFRTGGPLPFPNGTTCPLCNGTGGHRSGEASEVVQLKVEWEPRKFWYPVPGLDIRVNHSVCQSKGLVDVLPKVQQCDHMVVQLPIQGTIEARFRLLGQPIMPGNIIQGRYFVATWEQFN